MSSIDPFDIPEHLRRTGPLPAWGKRPASEIAKRRKFIMPKTKTVVKKRAVITETQKAFLRDLGYTLAQIGQMAVSEAGRVIREYEPPHVWAARPRRKTKGRKQ